VKHSVQADASAFAFSTVLRGGLFEIPALLDLDHKTVFLALLFKQPHCLFKTVSVRNFNFNHAQSPPSALCGLTGKRIIGGFYPL
jgi:hypothetical protein